MTFLARTIRGTSDYFHLAELGTTFWTEFRAGLSTFLTMAYILAANPFFLTQAGVPADVAIIGTAWAAAIGSILMGVITNMPFAMAPGMGLNAFLVFGVILGLGVTWQVGMGVIVIEGLLVFLAVQLGLRTALMKAIPRELKMAIGAGIGVFLLALGLESAGVVLTTPMGISVTTLTYWAPSLATEITPSLVLASLGLSLYIVFKLLKLKGAILFSIVLTTIAAVSFGVTPVPSSVFQAPGLPTLISFGDVLTVVLGPVFYTSIFAFFIADFFDTLGTGVAISTQGKFEDRLNEKKTLKNFLGWDALAAVVSGSISASSTTTYIESGAGVAEGGKSGLTSVFVGLFFLLSLLFVPLIMVVATTPGATSAALIAVGIMMLDTIRKEIAWSELGLEKWVAIILTIVIMPLTKSISAGIGLGFVSFALLSLLSGKGKEVSSLLYVASLVFLASFFIK